MHNFWLISGSPAWSIWLSIGLVLGRQELNKCHHGRGKGPSACWAPYLALEKPSFNPCKKLHGWEMADLELKHPIICLSKAPALFTRHRAPTFTNLCALSFKTGFQTTLLQEAFPAHSGEKSAWVEPRPSTTLKEDAVTSWEKRGTFWVLQH